jgi:hypothetical protein
MAMADVLISYSKPSVQLTRELAEDLEAKGLSEWWDTDLLASGSFRQRIFKSFTIARRRSSSGPRTPSSRTTSSRRPSARTKAGELIQVRPKDVDPGDLPPPFETEHASLVDDVASPDYAGLDFVRRVWLGPFITVRLEESET